MKTNNGLVKYAKAQLGLPYWYGTFGQEATADLYEYKQKQYPRYYKSWDDFPTQYGKRVHDCVGLIKGYLWSDTPTSKPKYFSKQDVSANGMHSKCLEKGPIDKMPNIPGVLVFMQGHVGIYIGGNEVIGGGKVIEARGHEYGVVMTNLSERPWQDWGKCPWIEYQYQEFMLRTRPGTWNIRKGYGTNHKIICVVRGGNFFAASIASQNGWYYIDKLGGWISSGAVELIFSSYIKTASLKNQQLATDSPFQPLLKTDDEEFVNFELREG